MEAHRFRDFARRCEPLSLWHPIVDVRPLTTGWAASTMGRQAVRAAEQAAHFERFTRLMWALPGRPRSGLKICGRALELAPPTVALPADDRAEHGVCQISSPLRTRISPSRCSSGCGACERAGFATTRFRRTRSPGRPATQPETTGRSAITWESVGRHEQLTGADASSARALQRPGPYLNAPAPALHQREHRVPAMRAAVRIHAERVAADLRRAGRAFRRAAPASG